MPHPVLNAADSFDPERRQFAGWAATQRQISDERRRAIDLFRAERAENIRMRVALERICTEPDSREARRVAREALEEV